MIILLNFDLGSGVDAGDELNKEVATIVCVLSTPRVHEHVFYEIINC